MNEQAATYAKCMIDSLLSVHALANMHRASGNDEYRQTATRWLPILENQLRNLREELTRANGGT